MAPPKQDLRRVIQNGTSIPNGLFRGDVAEDDSDYFIRKSGWKVGTTEVIFAEYMIGHDEPIVGLDGNLASTCKASRPTSSEVSLTQCRSQTFRVAA